LRSGKAKEVALAFEPEGGIFDYDMSNYEEDDNPEILGLPDMDASSV